MTRNMNLYEASTQWMNRPADERYQSLTDLRDAVVGIRNRSRAVNVDLQDVKVLPADGGELVVNSGIVPAKPTHWAFGQMARLAGAPAAYLRTLPAPLAAQCLNDSIGKADRERFKVMSVRNESGGTDSLAAVTSTSYGRIWDADVVDAVIRIRDRSGGRFFNPKDCSGTPSGLYASDHDCFMLMIDGGSLVDGGGDRDQMHRGFMVWNSQVGAATFGLMTFLFRVCCGNHIIWDAQDVTKLVVRHTAGGPGRFDREAMPALLSYANASARPVEDKVRAAKALKLGEVVTVPDEKVLSDGWSAAFAKRFGFTRGEVRDGIQFAKAEEGRCESIWDMVSGLTASARSIEFIDARIDLEKRAGKLMATVA